MDIKREPEHNTIVYNIYLAKEINAVYSPNLLKGVSTNVGLIVKIRIFLVKKPSHGTEILSW